MIELSATTLPPELNTTVGCWRTSLPTTVSVTLSSVFARVLGLLFDTRLRLLSVGTVLSNVTLVPSVTAVTPVPALPAPSE